MFVYQRVPHPRNATTYRDDVSTSLQDFSIVSSVWPGALLMLVSTMIPVYSSCISIYGSKKCPFWDSIPFYSHRMPLVGCWKGYHRKYPNFNPGKPLSFPMKSLVNLPDTHGSLAGKISPFLLGGAPRWSSPSDPGSNHMLGCCTWWNRLFF